MQRFVLLLGLVCLGSLTTLSAQMTVKGVQATAHASELPELAMEDLSIYADDESQTFFIDFEQLAINVNDVVVRNTTGQVVWQEEVYDLPVNTIYELDFSTFTAGSYFIELRAYTGVIRKEVQYKG